jgi:hypothetical protein
MSRVGCANCHEQNDEWSRLFPGTSRLPLIITTKAVKSQQARRNLHGHKQHEPQASQEPRQQQTAVEPEIFSI